MIQGGDARAMKLTLDVLRAGAASGMPPPADHSHAGLRAVSELFAICGGREAAVAA